MIFTHSTYVKTCPIVLILVLLTCTTIFGQWTTDGSFIEPNTTNNNNQRSVRLFTSLAGADRGYMVYSGNPGNVGTLSMALLDHPLGPSPFVQLNGNGRDLRFATDGTPRIFVDKSNGFVGIGNEAPDARLHIGGNMKLEGASPAITINRQSGETSAIIFTTNGTSNSQISVSQNGMEFKGGLVGPQISNVMKLNANGDLTVPRTLNLNEGNPTDLALSVRSDEALWYNDDYFSWGFGGSWNRFAKPIKIGNATAPANGVNLDVAGNVHISGELIVDSDFRLKKEIETLSGSLENVMKIKPVSYRYKFDEFEDLNLPQRRKIGLIAQQLEDVFPNLVSEGSIVLDQRGNSIHLKSVNYLELVPVLTAAIQELHQLVESQQQQIEAQQKLLEEIQSSLK